MQRVLFIDVLNTRTFKLLNLPVRFSSGFAVPNVKNGAQSFLLI